MYFDYPVYNASLESERRIINTDHVEQVKLHANVPVDPGAVDTACVEFTFYSGENELILIDYDTVKAGMKTFFGIVDANGIVT